MGRVELSRKLWGCAERLMFEKCLEDTTGFLIWQDDPTHIKRNLLNNFLKKDVILIFCYFWTFWILLK